MASSSEAGGYKSQICYFWLAKRCMYGHNCRYSHGTEEQRQHLFPYKSNATTGSAEAVAAGSTNSSINATPAAEVAATTSSTNSPINATPAAEVAATTSSTNSPINATLAAEAAATGASTNSPINATLAAEAAATGASTNSSINPEQPIRGRTISNIGRNWSPQDDGIEIKPLPTSTTGEPPSRDEVDAYLEAVLYGPKIKERPECFPTLLPD